VTLFEDRHLGGTCLNEGCIPTKVFCRHAEIIDTLKEADKLGLDGLQYSLDFGKITQRKQEVVGQLRSGVELLMKTPGITVVNSRAVIAGIDGDMKVVRAGNEDYEAGSVIIATGSVPKMLRLEHDLPDTVVNSSGLLDITEVPRRLCIIGAGVIGMEFASCFNAFGSKVSVVEFLKECLPSLDSDIAKRLRQTISKKGVDFYMQSGVRDIVKNDDGTTRVIFERKGKIEEIEADLVLMATGRAPQSSDVFSIGFQEETRDEITIDRGAILVDDNMMTGLGGIYAIGDVNGRCMLAHAAEFQARRAVNHILGKDDDIRLDIIPSAVFTSPEAASVGKTEDQCKDEGIAYTVGKSFYRSNGKAVAMMETDGMLKLISETDSGRIIGCHVYGAHAADLAQEASVLMCKDATVADLAAMVHAHPTISEILLEAAL